MKKLCTEFSVSEKNTIEGIIGDYYEVIKELNGNCYVLCDKGDRLYNECFSHTDEPFFANQKYELVEPNRCIRMNYVYMVETKDEPGIWYKGRLDLNQNLELTCCADSLEDILESL